VVRLDRRAARELPQTRLRAAKAVQAMPGQAQGTPKGENAMTRTEKQKLITKRWRMSHPTYNREWMRKAREAQSKPPIKLYPWQPCLRWQQIVVQYLGRIR
jgi:hypothetical protein